ncbi:MAG: hypothetical protein PHF70_05310, partial [Opitutales bacterium]|nr:hypothetical protein [Opitutales bacterium]
VEFQPRNARKIRRLEKRSSFFVLFESSVVKKNSSYLDRINRIYRIGEEAILTESRGHAEGRAAH